MMLFLDLKIYNGTRVISLIFPLQFLQNGNMLFFFTNQDRVDFYLATKLLS